MGNVKNKKIDLIKGFAIFIVVYGHTIQYGSGIEVLSTGSFFDDIVFKIIYSFHMPLFMLISGYLFGGSIKRHSFGRLIKSRITTIVIPIAAWSFIPFMITVRQSELLGIQLVKKYIGTCIREYWYLWAIFYCSIAVLAVSRYFKDSIIIYIIGWIITFWIPDSYNLFLYKYMYPFFVAGYFYREYADVIWKKLDNIMTKRTLMIVFALLYAFLLLFFEKESYIYISGYTLIGKNWGNQVIINVYRMLIGFSGSIVIILLLNECYEKLNEENIKYWIYMGKNSLGIYIISGLFFTYLMPGITGRFQGINYIISLIETIIIIICSLLITKIIQNVSFLNRILFGGRS